MAHEAAQLDSGETDHSAHWVGRYWIVWIILIACTALTVYTGHYHPNIIIALVIAAFKATLVIMFFMHMTEAPPTNRVVFTVSLVFTAVMMAGVFGDLLTRDPMSLPNGSVPSEAESRAQYQKADRASVVEPVHP